MTTRSKTLTLATLLAACAGPALAQPVEIQFAGTFDAQANDPNNLNNLALFEGQAFTYTFTYDPAAADRNAANDTGEYLFTTNNEGGRLDLEPFAVTEREHDEMLAQDPPGSGGSNDPTVSISANNLDPTPLGLPSDPIAFTFNLSGELLPFDIADFDFGNTGINPLPRAPEFLLSAPPTNMTPTLTLDVAGGTETLGGSISSISIVPEPSSLVILGVGALFLAQRRRR